MSSAELFAWVVFVCFSGGLFVGRLVGMSQVTKTPLTDWNRLFLCLYFSMGIETVEQAAKIGWLPKTVLVESLVSIGFWLTLLAMLYFVVRCYRQSRTGAV